MRRSRQSLRKQILDNSNKGLEMDTDHLVEYNPKLSEVTPVTRVAYVKFMTTKMKKDAADVAAATAAAEAAGASETSTSTFENERRQTWKRSSLKNLVDMKDKISVSGPGRGLLQGYGVAVALFCLQDGLQTRMADVKQQCHSGILLTDIYSN